MDRAFRLPLKDNTQQNKVECGIPLVLTYNPAFRNLSTTLLKNSNILYSDAEVRTVFTPSSFVAYRSARNLTSFLVRSKVYLLEKTVGSFESFQTKKQYKINHQLDCNDKCLIYLLSCKICRLQYVGSTTDRFRLTWNNYKDNDRKARRGEEHMQPELFEHFHSKEHNGFLQN